MKAYVFIVNNLHLIYVQSRPIYRYSFYVFKNNIAILYNHIHMYGYAKHIFTISANNKNVVSSISITSHGEIYYNLL